MFKIFLFFIIAIVFSGCIGQLTSSQVKGHKKAFEQEDAYILFALRAEQLHDYNSSSKIYNALYEKSDKKEYLYKSLQNDLAAHKYEAVVNKIDSDFDDSLNDFILQRMKILALLKLNRTDEARILAIDLVLKSRKSDDYILVSDIYVKQKKYETALKYLESAYISEYNEKILDKIAIILYVNLERKKEAIAQLETHSRVHACSKLICSRLIGFYSNENDLEGLLSTYLRLYKIDSSKEVADKIVQIYGYKKDYVKLVSFLQESQNNDELLLQLYVGSKNYKKAFPLSDKIYSKTGDIIYLGQSAIFEYESSEDKNDKSMQERVVKKLKKVIAHEENPIYLNYLGYLMIDHDIDVKEGMNYVRKALESDSSSVYYLDSLAWGYYKLGECKKAKKTIDKILHLEGGDDSEVISHVKAINKCLKGKN